MRMKETLCHDTPPRWFLETLPSYAKVDETRDLSVQYRLIETLAPRVTDTVRVPLKEPEPKE